MMLYECKYILNTLKIFIFQFYAIENLKIEENTEDFYYKDLFDLFQQLYFEFPNFNLYHNIFIDMIKLLSLEKSPDYLISHFLSKQTDFISNIVKNFELNGKYNTLIGTNLQILLIIFTSINPAVIAFYKNNSNFLEKKIKDKFMIIMNPRLDRKLNQEYYFTEEEIFSDENDRKNTFDGNDVITNYNDKKYESLKTSIQNLFKAINIIYKKNSD